MISVLFCFLSLEFVSLTENSQIKPFAQWQFFPMGFPGGSVVKYLPANAEMQETRIPSLGWEDPLKEEMATHFSILA